MSPILTDQQQPEIGEDCKFVRVGETIAFGDHNLNHSVIAKNHRIGVAIEDPNSYAKLLVDDAGRIHTFVEGILSVQGVSFTCRLNGNADKARQKTCEIVEKITRKRVEQE